jgi:alkaline phosphatase D
MPIDRRRFLFGAASAGVVLGACKPSEDSDSDIEAQPAPVREPGPPPFEAPGPFDEAVFPWSLTIGDPQPDGMIVGVRANADVVTVVLMWFEAGEWVEAGRFPGRDTEGWAVTTLVTGLESDRAYAVYAETDDGVRSRATQFRTAPAPDAFRRVRILATSCLGRDGSNDNELANLHHMAGVDPDCILLLGDSIYADGSVTTDDYRASWNGQMGRAGIQAMFASGAVVATWDDHELANNWVYDAPGSSLQDTVTPEMYEAGTQAWRDAIPQGIGPGGSGVWRQLRYGPVDVFVLDCRGERHVDGAMMSDEQLDWFVEALQASDASFKLVMTSIHATDHTAFIGAVQDVDRWQGYPEQRARLITAAASVPGTFFVTGDMHYGAVQRLDAEGGPGADLYEIAAGPGGSRIFPVLDVAAVGGGDLPPQYETMLQTWTFSVIDLDPGTGEVHVQFIDDDNTVAAEQTFVLALS